MTYSNPLRCQILQCSVQSVLRAFHKNRFHHIWRQLVLFPSHSYSREIWVRLTDMSIPQHLLEGMSWLYLCQETLNNHRFTMTLFYEKRTLKTQASKIYHFSLIYFYQSGWPGAYNATPLLEPPSTSSVSPKLRRTSTELRVVSSGFGNT